ncbi:S-layer homology domain-containing protein [Radiobacillus deserti]|uniref:S-layer homology domain-containing protein n=1 Tax=Radiobacillus deserti TaxID=2594883 RepID=A0A516KJE3_9BACI|nr:S-layer homology domain-containing protein [Radiobacillus deserti]QDP41492.1 S-layer homology domain-containing protein [Radiobacillus deserti]
MKKLSKRSKGFGVSAAVLTGAAISMPLAPPTHAAGISFSDLDTNHMAYDAVKDLTSKGILKGYPSGEFKPNEKVSREHTAVILFKALNLKVPDNVSSVLSIYEDIDSQSPYAKEIAAVTAAGIFHGDNGNFEPKRTITRNEMAVVLVKAFHLQDKGTDFHFEDINDIPKTFQPFVKILAQHKITVGSMNEDGNRVYRGGSSTTRAQMAVFVHKSMLSSTSIERYDQNSVVIAGETYAISKDLQPLFKEENQQLLLGASIKFETSNKVLTQITGLEITNNPVSNAVTNSLDGGGVTIEGNLAINGSTPIKISNLTVTGDLTIESEGFMGEDIQINGRTTVSNSANATLHANEQPSILLRDATLDTVDVNLPKVQLTIHGQSNIKEMNLYQRAGLSVEGPSSLSTLNIHGGVDQLQLNGSIDKLILQQDTTNFTLEGSGHIIHIQLKGGKGNINQQWIGTIDVFEIFSNDIHIRMALGSTIRNVILHENVKIEEVFENYEEIRNYIQNINGQTNPYYDAPPVDHSDRTPPTIVTSKFSVHYDPLSKKVTLVGDAGAVSEGDAVLKVYEWTDTDADGVVKADELQAPIQLGNSAAAGSVNLSLDALAEGAYNLVITATDASGNESEKSASYVIPASIDKTSPMITGVTDGTKTNQNVIPNSSASDVQSVVLKKDNIAIDGYTLGTPITGDGAYVLTVTDDDGNRSEVAFTIDKIAPDVSGVTDQQTYNTSVTPTSTASDIATITLVKNGTIVNGYVLGTPISEDGDYILTVTDLVGNSMVVSFTIDKGAYGIGDGSIGNPYVIDNVEQLNHVRDNLSAHYVLNTDIDMSQTSYKDGWAPIGTTAEPFSGTLKGNGKVIENLKIQANGATGLFGAVADGSEISNLTLTNASISNTGNGTGILVGHMAGGVVTDVTVSGNINTNGSSAGTLVGYMNAGSISNSSGSGSVTGVKGGINMGGLIGIMRTSAQLNHSDADTDVHSLHSEAGGLVGANEGTITHSFALGSVFSNFINVGGLVGSNHGSITQSYSTVEVKGGSGIVGGLVGLNEGTITETYAAGAVNSSGVDVGGLVGKNNNTVSSSFYDMQITTQSDTGKGIPLSTLEMKQQSTYTNAGWDFTNTWFMPTGDYPEFKEE